MVWSEYVAQLPLSPSPHSSTEPLPAGTLEMPTDASERPRMISKSPSNSHLSKRLDSGLCVLLGTLSNSRMNSHQINISECVRVPWCRESGINLMRELSKTIHSSAISDIYQYDFDRQQLGIRQRGRICAGTDSQTKPTVTSMVWSSWKCAKADA